jgi:hypothetical protein
MAMGLFGGINWQTSCRVADCNVLRCAVLQKSGNDELNLSKRNLQFDCILVGAFISMQHWIASNMKWFNKKIKQFTNFHFSIPIWERWWKVKLPKAMD